MTTLRVAVVLLLAAFVAYQIVVRGGGCNLCDGGHQNAVMIDRVDGLPSRSEEYVVTGAILGVVIWFTYLCFRRE